MGSSTTLAALRACGATTGDLEAVTVELLYCGPDPYIHAIYSCPQLLALPARGSAQRRDVTLAQVDEHGCSCSTMGSPSNFTRSDTMRQTLNVMLCAAELATAPEPTSTRSAWRRVIEGRHLLEKFSYVKDVDLDVVASKVRAALEVALTRWAGVGPEEDVTTALLADLVVMTLTSPTPSLDIYFEKGVVAGASDTGVLTTVATAWRTAAMAGSTVEARRNASLTAVTAGYQTSDRPAPTLALYAAGALVTEFERCIDELRATVSEQAAWLVLAPGTAQASTVDSYDVHALLTSRYLWDGEPNSGYLLGGLGSVPGVVRIWLTARDYLPIVSPVLGPVDATTLALTHEFWNAVNDIDDLDEAIEAAQLVAV